MSNDGLAGNAVYDVLIKSRKLEPLAKAANWDISDVFRKSMEELGEFSEACMIREGKIQDKGNVTDDDIIAEAADVSICILDALARSLPHRSASEIFTLYLYYLNKKSDKWESKLIK